MGGGVGPLNVTLEHTQTRLPGDPGKHTYNKQGTDRNSSICWALHKL